jgi:hypothetical protein
MPLPLSSISFPIIYSLTTLPFDATQPEVLAASLNKVQVVDVELNNPVSVSSGVFEALALLPRL